MILHDLVLYFIIQCDIENRVGKSTKRGSDEG